MLTVFILGLSGFAVVAIWLNQKSGLRDSRGDASSGVYIDSSSAGHVHSDHCGHGHDGGGDCGGDGGGGDGGGGGD